MRRIFDGFQSLIAAVIAAGVGFVPAWFAHLAIGADLAPVWGYGSVAALIVVTRIELVSGEHRAASRTKARRRMALGATVGSPNSYRYFLVGLGAVSTIWLAWVVFGWVPIAGQLPSLAKANGVSPSLCMDSERAMSSSLLVGTV